MLNCKNRGLLLLLLAFASPLCLLSKHFGQEAGSLTIESVLPERPYIGDTVEISGTGFVSSDPSRYRVYFNTSVYVNPTNTWYDSSRATIVSITATKLRVIVPPRTVNGNVAVYLDNVVADPGSGVYFGVRPRILSFSPRSLYVGDTITITGTGFDGRHSNDLIFGFNGPRTSAFMADFTWLKAVVPTGAATGGIAVLGSFASKDTLTILPSIESALPTTARIGNVFNVTAHSIFSADAAKYHLTINGVEVKIESINGDLMVTHIPPLATSGPLVLKYKNQVVRGSGIHIEVLPPDFTISKYDPAAAKTGQPIVIRGHGFDRDNVSVTFPNGKKAKVDSLNNDAIYVHVPQGTKTGQIIVTIDKEFRTLEPGVFTILVSATSVFPDKADIGDTVVYSGGGFYTDINNYYLLQFPKGILTVLAVTDTTLSFVVTGTASSAAPILRSSHQPGVQDTLPFLYVRPKLTSLSPDTVIAGRETVFKINGESLGVLDDSLPFTVHFSDGISKDSLSVLDFQIITRVPKAAVTGPVYIDIGGMVSNSLMLVVIPDTAKVITAVSAETPKATLHPNPTGDFIILSGLNHPPDYANIITTTGKTTTLPLKHENYNERKIDVQTLAPGIYILKIPDGGNTRTFKFIKQ